LNKVCNTTKQRNNTKKINKLVVGGKDLLTDCDIATGMNDYFCNVGVNLVQLLPQVQESYTDFMKGGVKDSLFCEPVTEHELNNLIISLNGKKSCGPDNISPQLVKENCAVLVAPLVYLYNLSFENGVVPDDLKIARVIPLFKKGDDTSPSNYRPISLLSIFNKLLEKLVYKRVLGFLMKNNVLYNYQFGFRKNYSTSLALMDVINNCYSNLALNNKAAGIFFDLQKAFDSVNHRILLDKLYHYGIRGVMYLWFENYLTNRKQYTFVNNVCSELGNVAHGVPQGSVLGPLLFILYVNDLANVVPDNQLKMFADDINLFIFDSNMNKLEVKANNYLKMMNIWFPANKLSLNINKTCYSVFSRNKLSATDTELNLYIGNQKIAKTMNCKYLGIFIDENLNWKIHIDYIYKKLIKFTGIFYKIRDVVPAVCLKKLYFAFIYPHILYGIEVYGTASLAALDKLYKLNNKILRILLKRKMDSPVKDLYVCYNTLPVYSLYKMQILIFVHKCLHHKCNLPVIFHNCFSENASIHGHDTRKKTDLHLYSVNSSSKLCSVSYGVKLWNPLPHELKQYCSISVFKRRIYEYLVSTFSLQ